MARRFEVVSGNPWRDNKGRFAAPTKSQYTKYSGNKSEDKQKIIDKDVYKGEDLYDKYVFPNEDVWLVNIDGHKIVHNDKRFSVEDPIKYIEYKTGYKNIDDFKIKRYNK